jgi:hypothetical protein
MTVDPKSGLFNPHITCTTLQAHFPTRVLWL